MNWPLNDSNFTFLDRIKIASFILNKNNFWTMANEVEEFERKMCAYVGSKYAVFVSSGSTANTILAMYLKDKVFKTTRNVVVVPSTTWLTSISPFIREGFKPHFIDISKENFGMDLDALENYLDANSKKVACVFITSLIGFSPNIGRLKIIEKKYKVRIMLDNCESTLTRYGGKNISSYFTSTTSTYFGHLLQSVEGGFIFTNDEKEYEYFLMARNHGMVRSLKTNQALYRNIDVDQRFDFNFLGNNYRNTNINAFIGQLDLVRAEDYIQKRRDLYNTYTQLVRHQNNGFPVVSRLELRSMPYTDVPFCIPLIFNNKEVRDYMKDLCEDNGIETRPIISGNLLRQTCFKKYGKPLRFENSELIHNHGFYVGLHNKVNHKRIIGLINLIGKFTIC